MFKNRNMELVEETGKLRKELENAKQQLLILQNTSPNPNVIMHVLNEMTKLSVGQPAESLFAAALPGASATGREGMPGNFFTQNVSTANRGAEFAAELERMPLLPGVPMVHTVKDMPSFGPLPVHPLPPISDVVVPCVFSQ
jgi:hypothetical protein